MITAFTSGMDLWYKFTNLDVVFYKYRDYLHKLNPHYYPRLNDTAVESGEWIQDILNSIKHFFKNNEEMFSSGFLWEKTTRNSLNSL